jgi:serine protease AprX
MLNEASFTSRRGTALLALSLAAVTSVATLPAGATGTALPSAQVIVTSLAGDASAAAAAVRAAGGRVVASLSLIGGVSAQLPAGTVLAPSYRVVPNAPLEVAGKGKGVSGAPSTARETVAPGLLAARNGEGVTVAVVDTGVADVPDLKGRVTHVDVTGDGKGDDYGHGTFVAGVVAGDGTSSDGAYAGVAPGAQILDVRVADKNGRTSLSTVLQGLQQVAKHDDVDVVNLSLASGSPLPYQIDPLSQALEALWRRGVTVVVPSGNEGPDSGTVTAPGTDPVLLTVGGLDESGDAVRGNDVVADWSGRGPAPQGVAKPDLVAPGSHLVSLRAPGSKVDKANPKSRVGDNYFRGSGTSFSTAVTSGAVAILLQDRDLTPGQVKALVTGTAYKTVAGGPDATGAGGLDVTAALAAPAPTDPGTGLAPIPGDPAVWSAFLDALISGDRAAAASSWSQLSVEARNWAASSWSSLSPEARNWAASSWSARNWAGPDGTAEEWLARNWAARNWAARNWSARNWAEDEWSARNWAARNWAGEDWEARNWSARNWADSEWAARNWSARNWSARNWSGIWD